MVILHLSECVSMKNKIVGSNRPMFSPTIVRIMLLTKNFLVFKGMLKCSLMSKNQSMNKGKTHSINKKKKITNINVKKSKIMVFNKLFGFFLQRAKSLPIKLASTHHVL